MKKTAIFSLSLLAAFGAFAQAKLDVSALQKLSVAQIAAQPASRAGDARQIESIQFENAAFFVTVADEEDFETLKDEGYTILASMDEMAIVSVTPAQLIALSEHPLVKKITGSEEAQLLIKDARAQTGVDAIHQGSSADADLPSSFSGKGVVVGMMDTGLDINHVNFLKDVNANGYFTKNPGMDIENRASRVWWISSRGVVKTYDTPEKIAAFDTDEAGETHATHVLGIAAGSFRGRLNAPTFNDRGGIDITPKANPYYGIAYDADLAVAAGQLDGENINIALNLIADYAQSVGKPVAMNLSLGHNVGPHDGTTDANKWMNKHAEKNMIICVSSGNEADMPIALERELAAGASTVKTFLAQSGTANGTWDIWGSDATPLTVTYVIMDKDTGNPVFSKKLDTSGIEKDKKTYYLTGTYYRNQNYDMQDAMDKYFGTASAVLFTYNINPNNNRFNVRIQAQSFAPSSANSKRYIPAIYVEGAAGQRVCMYGNTSSGFYSNGLTGFADGTNDGSINDMACAENVIAVGAYVNKDRWPINGNHRTTLGFNGVKPGEIAYFSSFGKTFDGRQLPHIAAPGMGMISSMSHYYYANLKEGDTDYEQMAFSINEGTKRKRSSYWVEMSGTSMAAPFVTGVMALWLEADPTLTAAEAKKIMMETATKDEYTRQYPERFGAGKINALEGLKKVLKISSGIHDVASDGRDILINQVGSNDYDLFCAGADEIRAELYSIAGQLVASRTAKGDNMVFTPEADHGIYILRVSAGDRTATQKVTLR